MNLQEQKLAGVRFFTSLMSNYTFKKSALNYDRTLKNSSRLDFKSLIYIKITILFSIRIYE